ncbi:MAG: TetR family transcriptional regulator [Pseudonocardiaceae bacterium]
MPPDSTATRARLLDAAFEEFAQHGLAGARVDRIAEAAQANKRLIYVYYGNKAQLFDTVLAQRVGAVFDAVPFTAEDLPDFAGALFDHLLGSPKLLRLGNWDQLERTDPPATEIAQFREKIEAIARAQKRGVITADLEPADLLVLLLGMVCSRFHLAYAVVDPAPEDAWSPQCLHRHRAALTTAVGRLVAPSPHFQPYETDLQKRDRAKVSGSGHDQNRTARVVTHSLGDSGPKQHR